MPKLLQLNATANWGSTGKIAEGIGQAAMARGWESYIAYGRSSNPSASQLIKIGETRDVYLHYAKNRLFDAEGLGSKRATKKLIEKIEKLNPDIIHLHNIHDHWLNYPILFEYLASIDTPIVWTFHDCWAFTGGCYHFVEQNCYQWQSKCEKCPFPKKFLRREAKNFLRKTSAIQNLKNRLLIVTVSSWLNDLVSESQLKDLRHDFIYNGVDTSIFKPRDFTDIINEYNLKGKKILLGVSSVWPASKGFADYIELSRMLDDSFRIVLIGLPKELSSRLPSNMIGIERTQNVETLAKWYCAASAVLSLSKAETFGLTLAEGQACGTPSIGFATTAIKETIQPETGIRIEPGNIQQVAEAVKDIVSGKRYFDPQVCREYAVTHFNKDVQFGKYVDLYESLLRK